MGRRERGEREAGKRGKGEGEEHAHASLCLFGQVLSAAAETVSLYHLSIR
ncbi:MAG: hypothetical protein ACKERG_00590 [Candidatus Hodgkinia cicadicola]